MKENRSDTDILLRQLLWTLAALDLCLDMERNAADSLFVSASEENEILYTFDTDIFELFIGGKNEPPSGRTDVVADAGFDGRIFTDRRRSIAIFHSSEWRDRTIPRAEEEAMIGLNRQSAALTSEWLFGGILPGMRDVDKRHLYISAQHLAELHNRWSKLVPYYRGIFEGEHGAQEEKAAYEAFTLQLSGLTAGPAQEMLRIEGADDPWLEEDVASFRESISGQGEASEGNEPINQFIFSRRLAKLLTEMRITEPLSQLIRIHGEIASRLKLLHTAMPLDEYFPIPDSETPSFWEKILKVEIANGVEVDLIRPRSERALSNDAQTLARVQAMANTAIRTGSKKRIVFVTADSLIIDTYRAWHCNYAAPYEPFILRPIRHFAPLLNVGNMTAGFHATSMHSRENIFPKLKEAIEPFLLKLNLTFDANPGALEKDMSRWPREYFASKLRKTVRRAQYQRKQGRELDLKDLRNEVAKASIFDDSAFSELAKVDATLNELASAGKKIERSVIGFGFPFLKTRLQKHEEIREIQERMAAGDESALAIYLEEILNKFGDSNLELKVRHLTISTEIEDVVKRRKERGLSTRAPLNLLLTYSDNGSTEKVKILALAENLISTAMAKARTRRGTEPFDADLRDSNIGEDGGFRLFALYACVAFRLAKWDLASQCAGEAKRRADLADKSVTRQEVAELNYLSALGIRFRLGSAEYTLDATGMDATLSRYNEAKASLQESELPRDHWLTYRSRAEKTSLMIFGCAWSVLKSLADEPTRLGFSTDFHLAELSECFHQLGIMFGGVFSDPASKNTIEGREVFEQVVTNIAAAYCLAMLASGGDGKRLSSFTGHLHKDSILASVDEVARTVARNPGKTSPISKFYYSWYLFFRTGEGAERVAPPSDLLIDSKIAQQLSKIAVV